VKLTDTHGLRGLTILLKGQLTEPMAMSDLHFAASLVGANNFHGELASVGSGLHVLFEWDDEFDALLIYGKRHFAVEETPINDQRTDCALGTDILFGSFQYGKDGDLSEIQPAMAGKMTGVHSIISQVPCL
jgi:hypothetical protein